MLVVLVVGFKLFAFIILLIKSSQFHAISCTKKNKKINQSINNDSLNIIEKSTIVEMKKELYFENEEYSRL